MERSDNQDSMGRLETQVNKDSQGIKEIKEIREQRAMAYLAISETRGQRANVEDLAEPSMARQDERVREAM
ncbi:unnamed protein product [Coregonus sp. 'balchen']|nr:unnamed protein product [Coregonus sp. 'balchen']